MSEMTLAARNSSTLTVRIPLDLKTTIERDAARLGVSIADAIRFRLRTGRVPAIGETDGVA
jgi:hypothetical protein